MILLINQKKANIILKFIGISDEAAGVEIKGFAGLRSKMYSYYFGDKCIKM